MDRRAGVGSWITVGVGINAWEFLAVLLPCVPRSDAGIMIIGLALNQRQSCRGASVGIQGFAFVQAPAHGRSPCGGAIKVLEALAGESSSLWPAATRLFRGELLSVREAARERPAGVLPVSSTCGGSPAGSLPVGCLSRRGAKYEPGLSLWAPARRTSRKARTGLALSSRQFTAEGPGKPGRRGRVGKARRALPPSLRVENRKCQHIFRDLAAFAAALRTKEKNPARKCAMWKMDGSPFQLGESSGRSTEGTEESQLSSGGRVDFHWAIAWRLALGTHCLAAAPGTLIFKILKMPVLLAEAKILRSWKSPNREQPKTRLRRWRPNASR